MALKNNSMQPGRIIYALEYWSIEEDRVIYQEYETQDEAEAVGEKLVEMGIAKFAHVYKKEYIDTFEREIIVTRRHNDT